MSAKPSGLAIAVRALLLALAGLVAIAVEAAPLGLEPRALPSPDLLACLVACWAVRAPEAAALVLVFALGLVRDLLTDLPIGLGALTLVLLAEAMRLRAGRASGWSAFLLEWLWFALAAAAMLALQWLGVLIGLAQPPYLSLLLRQYGATVLAYPLIALICRWGLRLRRPTSETL